MTHSLTLPVQMKSLFTSPDDYTVQNQLLQATFMHVVRAMQKVPSYRASQCVVAIVVHCVQKAKLTFRRSKSAVNGDYSLGPLEFMTSVEEPPFLHLMTAPSSDGKRHHHCISCEMYTCMNRGGTDHNAHMEGP